MAPSLLGAVTLSAAPDTTTHVDSIEHLDFDHETPCQIENCLGHHSPARWRLALVCGCVVLICQTCKERHVKDMADDPTATRGTYTCNTCRARLGRCYRGCFVSLDPLP